MPPRASTSSARREVALNARDRSLALLLAAIAAGYLLALVLSGSGAWVRWGLFPALLLGAGALLVRQARSARPPIARATRTEPTPPADLPVRPPASEAELLAHACELVRRATDAEDAALWIADAAATHVVRLARAGHVADDPEGGQVALEGHPFRWPVVEGEYTRLERGRRTLPLAWAAEMLLIPVPSEPRGVLVLGYPGIVPPGAEPAAHVASAHLAELLALLEVRRRAAREGEQLRATLEAVGAVAGENEVAPLAARLAEAVLGATGGAGAAVASWEAENGCGALLGTAGAAAGLGGVGRFGEGESRAALAAKYATSFLLPDLGRERERLPLLAPGERWSEPPRSALLVPLVAEERALGALIAWHPRPNHFSESERELLRVLARVAAPSMLGARAYDALNERASTDALTGLANRRAFEARLSATASYFDRYNRPFAVLILDVDHFKRFNDTWGHEAGDQVLRHMGETLRATVREMDLPARLGGEEFVVLLPETPLTEAREAAERLRRTIEARAVYWNGRPLSVTASIGVAACPDSGVPPTELLAAADAALYAAKQDGRNRVSAATPAPQREVWHN